MTSPSAVEIAERLHGVHRDIQELGVDPSTLEVVVVTKTREVEVVSAVRAAGVIDVGENYAQELAAKATTTPLDLDDAIRWHFIGRLQSNKVRLVADHVSLWQSVDRRKVGLEIAKRAPGAAVLVQVNVSGEAQKGGCAPSEAPRLVDELRSTGLDVQGLMAVAEVGGGRTAGSQFAMLRTLVDDLALTICSMGMSGDYREAVSEGSTMLRLGTSILGPRPSS